MQTFAAAKVLQKNDISKNFFKKNRGVRHRQPLNSRTPKVKTNGRNRRKDEGTKEKARVLAGKEKRGYWGGRLVERAGRRYCCWMDMARVMAMEGDEQYRGTLRKPKSAYRGEMPAKD